jgi:hypothetical protein
MLSEPPLLMVRFSSISGFLVVTVTGLLIQTEDPAGGTTPLDHVPGVSQSPPKVLVLRQGSMPLIFPNTNKRFARFPEKAVMDEETNGSEPEIVAVLTCHSVPV